MRIPRSGTMNNSSPKTHGPQLDVSSPLERVLSVPRHGKAALSTPNTPVLEDFPQNDDEKERMQRRRSRVFDLQFSTDSSHVLASPNRNIDVSTTISKYTNTQITEHYSTCIKLSTENKITTKNAFGLHLIDFMSEILKQKDAEPTNFKVAAGTLDASTKIYAVRVDAVHADVYRVLGGLGKETPSQEEVESHGADGSAVAPETTKKTAKTKKKPSCKTIEQNLSNINVSEADRKCEVDPMFQKTAASFDECSTAGVFLSSLHCQDYRSELLFPSDMQTLSSGEALELPDLGWVDMTDLKVPLQQCVEDRQLCPSLAGFQFTKWDSETHNESVSALVDKFKKNDQVFDIDAEVEDSDNEDVPDGPLVEDFDDNDEPDPSAAGDHEELGSWKNLCQVQSSQEQIISLGDRDVQTMCTFLSMKPGEYSYFSPRTMKMWAGPDHWCFRPSRPKQDTTSNAENKKKSAKKDFEINFDDDIDFDAYFQKTKAATTLTKFTLENQNWKATTLPTDFQYETDMLVQLHLKPGIELLKMGKNQKAKTEHYEEIKDYDYNNPNDTSNFCPGLQAGDSDDEEPDDLFEGPAGTFDLESDPSCTAQENGHISSENQVDITTYGELNLVAEPQKVNKIEIHYAKTAKKMDMKKLKQSMWSLLTDFSRKEADAETNPSVNGKEGAPEEVADKKVLSGLTMDLQKRLPPLMAQNLSIPLAFACLLHLANEKNLKLEGTEDLSDVLVLQGD